MKDLNFKKLKKWIDDADYEQLLYKWRYSVIGNPFFLGELGEYYRNVMLQKKKTLSPEKAIRISKKVGCCL